MCQEDFDEAEKLLENISKSVQERYRPVRGWNGKSVCPMDDRSIDWHNTGWTKEKLLSSGFQWVDAPTIIVVCNIIKLVYIPLEECTSAGRALEDITKHIHSLKKQTGKYDDVIGIADAVRGKASTFTGDFKMVGFHLSRR